MRFANYWRRVAILKDALELCVFWAEVREEGGKFGKKYNSHEEPEEKGIFVSLVCFTAVTT